MTNSNFHGALLACILQAGSAFFCASANAQNTSEVGLGLGATNYRGEISPAYQLQNNRPAFTAFYRKDVSAPVTLRGSFMAGLLRAADSNVKGLNGIVPPLQSYRQANTKGSLLEAAAVMEYNFRNFHYRTDKVHFTPYLFAGVAVFYATTTTATNNAALGADFNRQGSMLGLARVLNMPCRNTSTWAWKWGRGKHLQTSLTICPTKTRSW
ncbi:MAG: hypothetical protein NVS3B25_17100 [Hymenobacter sp.]